MSIHRLNGIEFRDLAGGILQTGHRLRFQASGASMHPFIMDGDIVEVAPLASEHVRYGDILLVENCDGKWLAHRVVKTRCRDGKLAILIKGDACPYPDDWFGSEQILGRVVAVGRGSQQISFTSSAYLWRARLWLFIAPWIPRFSWLPKSWRQHLLQLFFREVISQ